VTIIDESAELVPYAEAIRRSGLPERTWYDRLRASRDEVRVYQDGRDRRRHLIDARDLGKLTEMRPARPPAPRPRAA
jgi:hypothetical protein